MNETLPSRSSGETDRPPTRPDKDESAAGTARAGGGTDGGRRPAKPRDALFDNAKYLAIVLVAVGHAWEPLRSESRTVTALYTLVYAFHMPTFIIISGYFSRGFDWSPAKIKRLITGVAVPYVVFEVAYTFFTRWSDNEPDRSISLLDPLYLTWFLAALFIWRLTTPIWQTLRRPLPVALAVAALATLAPSIGKDLDLHRTLQFLPYFVLGLLLKKEHFEMVRRREVRILAVPVFAGALVVAYWSVTWMDYAWFFHNSSAEDLGSPAWHGPLMTLAIFGCSAVLVACFVALVPRRRTWFTALGAGTLYGYLLHGFFIQAANHWHWSRNDWFHTPVGETAVTAIAAVVVTALCTAPVRKVFRPVFEPKMDRAFRQQVPAAASAPARKPVPELAAASQRSS
ncbi:acyltransferase family protein [Streptomyces sp. KMM 9044]|nr:acyltransferase family protein [Streptomyces sp. KMM 9044]WAX76406.1 acyltransferase family protein [Streptomyces sp. KMM 9044]